jgi:hypothetical protein
MTSDILAWYDDDLLEWGEPDLLADSPVSSRFHPPKPPQNPWNLESEVKQKLQAGQNPVMTRPEFFTPLRGGNRASHDYYYFAEAYDRKKDMNLSNLAHAAVSQMRVNSQFLPVYDAQGAEMKGQVSSATLGGEFVKLIIKLPAVGYQDLRDSSSWPYVPVWFSTVTGKSLDEKVPFTLS